MLLLWAAAWAAEPPRYLLISSPSTSTVQYQTLPGGAVTTLLDSRNGLIQPSGLAVMEGPEPQAMRLYVADYGASKILEFKLVAANALLQVDTTLPPQTVARVKARWVAVDHVGTVFFTDGVNVQRVRRLPKSVRGGMAPPEHIYQGDLFSQVNKPAGVTADNFNVFWANSAQGRKFGSVIKGSEFPEPDEGPVHVVEVAKNANEVVGTCLTQNNLYFTTTGEGGGAIYGVKKMGGAVATVVEPGVIKAGKGCAWDGDGTVYIADEDGNAVHSFPGNMRALAPTVLDRHASNVKGPFGLAVVQPACPSSGCVAAGVMAVLVPLIALL